MRASESRESRHLNGSASVGLAGGPSLTAEDSHAVALVAALEAALRPLLVSDDPAVVLFSGGVDSGLLAWELRRRARTRLLTVGRTGSEDLRRASASADLIGLPWSQAILDDAALQRGAAAIESTLGSIGRGGDAVLLALTTAMMLAPPGRLICGQGADELFYGYAHFRGLSPGAAEARAFEDWRRLCEVDLPRARKVAAALGRSLECPFLDPAFVSAARGIAVEAHLPQTLSKPVLRRLATARGLPAPLALAPKKAIQYGSGVERWLRGVQRPSTEPVEAAERADDARERRGFTQR